jgi:hypothetical protein
LIINAITINIIDNQNDILFIANLWPSQLNSAKMDSTTNKLEKVSASPEVLNILMNGVHDINIKNRLKEKPFLSLFFFCQIKTANTSIHEAKKLTQKILFGLYPTILLVADNTIGSVIKCPSNVPISMHWFREPFKHDCVLNGS